jgi:hypothetical protein
VGVVADEQVTVNVLRILKEETYSDRLKHYFETLAEYHARPKDVLPLLLSVVSINV